MELPEPEPLPDERETSGKRSVYLCARNSCSIDRAEQKYGLFCNYTRQNILDLYNPRSLKINVMEMKIHTRGSNTARQGLSQPTITAQN
ncbi:MAG: hypothetical protein AAGB22_01790, partial [Bacteroidota bacterium]